MVGGGGGVALWWFLSHFHIYKADLNESPYVFFGWKSIKSPFYIVSGREG